jgi:hypothetical protein
MTLDDWRMNFEQPVVKVGRRDWAGFNLAALTAPSGAFAKLTDEATSEV